MYLGYMFWTGRESTNIIVNVISHPILNNYPLTGTARLDMFLDSRFRKNVEES